jgi:hypothetical protein
MLLEKSIATHILRETVSQSSSGRAVPTQTGRGLGLADKIAGYTSILEGMQPLVRQVPPSFDLSITAHFMALIQGLLHHHQARSAAYNDNIVSRQSQFPLVAFQSRAAFIVSRRFVLVNCYPARIALFIAESNVSMSKNDSPCSTPRSRGCLVSRLWAHSVMIHT